MTRRQLVAAIERIAERAHEKGDRLKYNEAFGMVLWNRAWCNIMAKTPVKFLRVKAGLELESLSKQMQNFIEDNECGK